jgi:hypothetical protein
MRTLHRLLIEQLRDTAEALAVIEFMCDAVVEREFDLVDHCLNQIKYLINDYDYQEIKKALDNARSNNE